MSAKLSHTILLLSLLSLFILFGCTLTSSPIDIAKNYPQVQDFIAQHPNASVSLSAYSTNDLETDMNYWNSNCASEISVQEYYLLNIEDENTIYKALFGKGNMELICGIMETKSNGQNQNNLPVEICTENWNCTEWIDCSNGTQTRKCNDASNCGTTQNKPTEMQNCENSLEPVEWACTNWSNCVEGYKTRNCSCTGDCGKKPAVIEACGSACTEMWICDDWGSCANGQKTRECQELIGCETDINKPAETQTCEEECVENWSCNNWSGCVNGTQTRICTDTSSCGTTYDKPVESQTCAIECTENWNCTTWLGCDNGTQTRICTDNSSCGTDVNKPSETQTCEESSCNVETARPIADNKLEEMGYSNINYLSYTEDTGAYLILNFNFNYCGEKDGRADLVTIKVNKNTCNYSGYSSGGTYGETC